MADPIPAAPATPIQIAEIDDAALQKIAELEARYRFLEAGIKGVEKASDTASISIANSVKQEMELRQSQIKQVQDFKATFDKNPINGDKAKKELEKITAGTTSVSFGFKTMGAAMKSVMEDLRNGFAPLNNLLGSGSALALSKMRTAGVETFNSWSKGLLDDQQKVLELNKTILQTGVSFGSSFKKAADSIGYFRQDYIDTLLLVKSTPEEIKSVRDAFRNLVPVEEQTSRMTGLTRAYGSVKAALTPINEALFVSAATGMDAASVTSIMSSAYTELGSSMEETSLAFGDMFEMSKKSGLGFEIVAKSISESAKTLKMWGGNLSTVAPIFKAFSDGLAGTGKQGLTPQLLQSFISGINQMSFATRALFGMQLPAMKGVGALGAGLRMEAALEKKGPEGMKDVSESIIASLKQFGGGKVLTREEALENPQLEKNFLVQRQLLMQQMGLDAATANKTLSMLQNIDKNGIQTGEGSEDQLAELLSSGEKTQESTQSVLQETSQAQIAQIQTSTKEITNALGQMVNKLGGGAVAKEMQKFFTTAASKGNLSLKQIEDGVLNVMSAQERKQGRPSTEQKQEIMGKKEFSEIQSMVLKARQEAEKKTRGFLGEQSSNVKETAGRIETQNLMSALKNIGGGKIITRELAKGAENEEMFSKQKQYLMQQSKISESAATNMLGFINKLDINNTPMPNLPQLENIKSSAIRAEINTTPEQKNIISEPTKMAISTVPGIQNEKRVAERTEKELRKNVQEKGEGAAVNTTVKDIKFNDSTVTIKLGHVLTREQINQ